MSNIFFCSFIYYRCIFKSALLPSENLLIGWNEGVEELRNQLSNCRDARSFPVRFAGGRLCGILARHPSLTSPLPSRSSNLGSVGRVRGMLRIRPMVHLSSDLVNFVIHNSPLCLSDNSRRSTTLSADFVATLYFLTITYSVGHRKIDACVGRGVIEMLALWI